jgi:hypothetical protein
MTYVAQASMYKRFAAAAAILSFAAFLASPAMAKSQMANSEDDMSAQTESDIRLSLDKVELEADSGKLDEAESMIEKLEAKYPGNPDVRAVAADIDDRMSSRSSAVSELCLPTSLEPNNNDILMREREYGASNKNSACAGYNRRVTGEGYEQIASFDGQVTVLPASGVSLIYDLENDHLNTTEPFERASGGLPQSFYGDRQQGTLMLQKNFANHDQAGLAVFGNDAEAGAGAQYVMRDRTGGTSIQVNYNQPNWDYVEMIVQNGTKSDIVIERKQVITQNLQATLSGNVTHYALQNMWGAADAPGWNFNLDYSRPVKFFNQGDNDPSWMNDEFTLGAHYGVEAEYFTYVARRTDIDNETFNPLPTTTYEVHSFTGSIGKELLTNLDAEVEGGYGVDRISGTSGPLYGGSLTYSPLQHLGVDVHAMRTLLGGQNNGQKEDIAGAALKWTW